MDLNISSFAELIRLYRAVITTPPVRHDPEGGLLVLEHVSWMLDNMPDYRREPEKFMRWLGFVQGILWMARIYSLDQLREQTRTASLGSAGVTLDEMVATLAEDLDAWLEDYRPIATAEWLARNLVNSGWRLNPEAPFRPLSEPAQGPEKEFEPGWFLEGE